MTRSWWAEHAWLPGGAATRVLLETAGARITGVTVGADPPQEAERLAGLTLPGLANAHSHAFQRALRGRTQRGGAAAGSRGSFWTWREQMYRVAEALTPEGYLRLARAVYGEMALAGITCVGEFHYLHHAPGGSRYADPNAMAAALVEAAAQAGVRLTLLDTCYLTGGIGQPLRGAQLRFGDGDALAWAERAAALDSRLARTAHARGGAALHSLRAVPRDQLGVVADGATERDAPLHTHLSEQPAENAACLAAYGATPARVLAEAGALGPRTTAVHATHLTGEDVKLLGASRTTVCMCPTTERDLADGIGPARDLHGAGSPLALGTDSHAIIDPFEEARAVELNERLRTGERGHWSATELLYAATAGGHASLGWPEAGRLEAGALADFVTVTLNTPRLAGFTPETAAEWTVFTATPADVTHVVVGGQQIVRAQEHTLLGDVAGALSAAVKEVSE